MDPLTHGLLGAGVCQALYSRPLGRWAAAIGAVGGVLADVDIVTQWFGGDKAMMLDHRTVTHALLLIPIGGALAAMPFLFHRRFRQRRLFILLAGILAYATHGLLDALTTYGTCLGWPFSPQRVAWDILPIIDPVFTLILLVGVVLTLVRMRPRACRAAMLAAMFYIVLAGVQHQRALDTLDQVAKTLYHDTERTRAMPTLGNIIVWRGLYESNDQMYPVAIRLPVNNQPATVTLGKPLRLSRKIPTPAPMPGKTLSPVMDDILNWNRFTGGYAAELPDQPDVLADLRYSAEPESFQPLWGLKVDLQHPDQPGSLVKYPVDRAAMVRRLWHDLISGPPESVKVDEVSMIQRKPRAK
ncbi:MAG: metal-dependent hydrolase [Phycisphaeraceae bacterium]|nr:metal-dependent hydrolase [Phycisphaeraceae bacterium]